MHQPIDHLREFISPQTALEWLVQPGEVFANATSANRILRARSWRYGELEWIPWVMLRRSGHCNAQLRRRLKSKAIRDAAKARGTRS